LKADDDRVAVMILQNVRDGDQLQLSAGLHGSAPHEVAFRQLVHALPASAGQLDHRTAAEASPDSLRRRGRRRGDPGVDGGGGGSEQGVGHRVPDEAR